MCGRIVIYGDACIKRVLCYYTRRRRRRSGRVPLAYYFHAVIFHSTAINHFDVRRGAVARRPRDAFEGRLGVLFFLFVSFFFFFFILFLQFHPDNNNSDNNITAANAESNH